MKAVAIAIWALAVIQIPSAIQAWHFNACVQEERTGWKKFPAEAKIVPVWKCNGG